jgi:hypothetical protein
MKTLIPFYMLLICNGLMANSTSNLPEGLGMKTASETVISSIELKLENPLERERSNAAVVIPRHALNLPQGHTIFNVKVYKDSHFWVLPFQLDDSDADGLWDELYFQVNLLPREIARVLLETAEEAGKEIPSRVHAEVRSNEKIDRVIWESELMLYNMYGSTQVDCIGKLYPTLNSHKLYKGKGNQHKFSPDYGHDYMHVGHTMGAHSTFIFREEKFYRPWTNRAFNVQGDIANAAQIESELLYSGPLRTAIKTKVSKIQTPDGEMSFEMIQSIASKKRYTLVDVKPSAAMMAKGYSYGAGFRHFYEDKHIDQTEGYVSRVAYDVWEAGVLEERVARAIITPFDAVETHLLKNDPHLAFAPENGPNTGLTFDSNKEDIRYAYVSAWEKDQGYQSYNQWITYLKSVNEEMKYPVQVHYPPSRKDK